MQYGIDPKNKGDVRNGRGIPYGYDPKNPFGLPRSHYWPKLAPLHPYLNLRQPVTRNGSPSLNYYRGDNAPMPIAPAHPIPDGPLGGVGRNRKPGNTRITPQIQRKRNWSA